MERRVTIRLPPLTQTQLESIERAKRIMGTGAPTTPRRSMQLPQVNTSPRYKSVNVVVPKHIHNMDCSICLESNVPHDESLNCGHCVCRECLSQMRTDQCPVCRRMLKGVTVTDEIIHKINDKQRIDMENKIRRNEEIARLVAENPGVPPDEFYDF